MDLLALEDRLGQLATVVDDMIGTEMGIIAEQGKELVIQRLVETGRDANGSLFKGYTQAYEQRKRFAVSTAKREGQKKRAQRKIAAASQGTPIGRFTGFRNFTLTGEMLRRIGIIEQRQTAGRFVVRVGARDDENRQKMIGNDAITPGWWSMSEGEQKRVAGDSRVRLAGRIQQFLER